MKKLRFTAAILLAASLLLGGCAKTASTKQTSSSLPKTDKVVIGVYSGDWQKQINQAALDNFSKTTGVQVESVPGADAEWLTKIKAAAGVNPPYDVLILQPDTIDRAIAGNLLQPLDATNIPNIKNLYSSISSKFTKNGKLYAAGFSMGQLGIAYREDLVPVKPTKWADLWKSEYKGHVAISPLTYSAGLQFFAGLVHSQGGQLKNAADVNKAFDKLATLKDNIVAYPDSAGSLQTLIQRGDVWITPFWDGRVFAWKKQGLPIGFVYPQDGAVAAITGWSIVKGSPNLANAYKLVNYLSGQDVQKAFSDASFYGMSNKDVQYGSDIKSKVSVGESVYSKLTWVDYDTASPNLTAWTNTWSQKMGK